MAFPATDLPDPATWFANALITSALMKSNYTDPINLLPRPFYGEGNSTSSVTLSSTADFAGLGAVTFTLSVQRRVKITTMATFIPATAVQAGYRVQSAYNTGSSAVIGSVVKIGQQCAVDDGDATTRNRSGVAVGTVLLTAGTYTAYGAVARPAGGAATDTATNFYVLVEDLGAS